MKPDLLRIGAAIGRRLFRDPLELTLDGCLAAIEHAGLTTDDIDGISTYPGPMGTPARSNTPAMIIAEDIRRDSSRREQARGSDRQMQLRDKDERHEPGNRDIRERVKSESQCQIKRCAR